MSTNPTLSSFHPPSPTDPALPDNVPLSDNENVVPEGSLSYISEIEDVVPETSLIYASDNESEVVSLKDLTLDCKLSVVRYCTETETSNAKLRFCFVLSL